MSTTIDSRVVEMQFNNQRFEQNVRTSISTLDKLKQSLNLTGAAKGLENINAAAKNNNMSVLGGAVESVTAKFSALQIMGTTALVNLTNQAVNAGKRIVSALTIDPIKTGFSEYELKMDSIKTIMASTGESVETVNKYLEELNTYSDQTIYSFSDMTQNIGKFTNAGVKLEDAVLAIKGISNEAAVSGANANEASRAMYNFAQALSTGYIQRIDWKSIELANMATVEFKEYLLETAVAMGTVTKSADGMYTAVGDDKAYNSAQMFTEALDEQWLTSEVLIDTLKQYSSTSTDIGKKAFAAAQDVTKLTQVFDILKETAQSGWSKTWEIIFGDINQAKAIFTPLTDFFSKIINGMSNYRNTILQIALANPFQKLLDRIDKVSDATKAVTKVTKDYNDVVNRVIRGEFGHTQERWDKLTEMGYDWAHVQNLVNERMGSTVRRATQYKEAQDGVNDSLGSTIEQLTKLSPNQLKNYYSFDDEEIEQLKELEKRANQAGVSLSEVIEDVSVLDGRTLLINSFKNAGQALVDTFRAMKNAWNEIFHGDASKEEILNKRAEQLYNVIAALHKFSTYLKLTDDETGELNETGKKLQRTFQGIFALVDIITTILGGGFKIAFKLVSEILKYFNIDILDLTANLGDVIVKFRDWLDGILNFSGIVKKVAPLVEKVAASIKKWINTVKNSEEFAIFTSYLKQCVDAIKAWAKSRIADIVANVKEWIATIKDSGAFLKFIEYIKNSADSIREWIEGIKDAEDIPKYIIQGLVKGLLAGVKDVISAVGKIATGIITAICDLLRIASPSKVFIAIGGFIISGLVLGLLNNIPSIKDAFGTITSKIGDFFANVDWGKIFAVGISVALVILVKKIGDALDSIGSVFEGLGDIFESVSNVMNSFSSVLKGISFDFKAKAIQKLAIALAILVGSVLLLVKVGGDDYTKLWNAVGIILALAVILGILAFAMDRMSSASVSFKDGAPKIEGLKTGLIAIGASLLLLAATVKLIGSMSPEQAIQGFVGLAGLVGAIALVFVAYGKLIKGKAAQNIDKAGKLFLKLSVSLLLMVWVCKLVGNLSAEEMLAGGIFVGAFTAFVLALTSISLLAGKHIDKIGGMMIKMSIALGLMVAVVKLASLLSLEEMAKGALFAGGFLAFLTLLVLITKIGAKEIPKLGSLLLSISFSMAILVGVVKLVSLLSPEEMAKGISFALGFLGFLALLVLILKIGNEQQIAKVTGSILAVSVAMAALAATSIILGLIDVKDLAKGVTAVSILGLVMAGMIAAMKGVNDIKSNLIVMTVAIAVMAAAVAALSFIDTKSLAGASAAIGLLMGMFALMVSSAKKVEKAAGTILLMTVVIAALAGVLWAMSKLEVKNTLENAASLSLLMLAISAAISIISKMHVSLSGALMGIIALTAMAIPMLAFVVVLAVMSFVKNATENAIALSALMLSMAAVLGIITLCGIAIPAVITGVVGLLVVAGIAAAFVGLLAWMDGIENATTNANLLTRLMTFMVDLLMQISIVGPQALAGVAALAGLEILMVTMGALIVAIGALTSKFPWIEDFIDKGLPIMEKLATGLGTMVGNFVNGMLSSIAAGLPEIGKNLSEFMNNVMPFVEGAKLVDESVVTGVACLAKAVIALTIAELINALAQFIGGDISLPDLGKDLSEFMINVLPFVVGTRLVDESTVTGAACLSKAIIALSIAELINGLTSLFSGNVSLPQLGKDLSKFIDNAMPFIEGVRLIDPAAVSASKTLVEVILLLTAAEVLQGITSLLPFGDSGFDTLGETLSAFAEAIIDFSNTITEGGGIDVAAIEAASKAGMLMVELQKSLPRTGGWLQQVLGEKDLGDFGKKCAAFGEAMKMFSDSVSGENALDSKAIKTAAKAGELMSELQNTLPKTGGWLQMVLGEQDIATFGARCASFGKAMKMFSDSVSGENAIDAAAIEAAHKAGGLMSELQNTLPKTGGWIQAIAGEQDIADFGKKCAAFGEAMASIPSISISDDTITSITKAGEALVALQDTLPKTGGVAQFFTGEQDFESFGEGCISFTDAMSTLSGMSAIDETTIESIKSAGKVLVELQKILPESGGWASLITGEQDMVAFGNGCSSFADAMSTLGNMPPITDTTLESIKSAKVVIKEFADAIPENNLFDGKASLGGFSNQISLFADAMKKFSEVPEISDSMMVSVENAGIMIQDFTKGIPESDCFLDKLDLGVFSAQINIFANAMKRFAEVPEISESMVATVENAGTMINTFADGIPESDCFLDKLDLGLFSAQISIFANAIKKFSEVPEIGDITSISNAGKMITEFTDSIPESDCFLDKIELGLFSSQIDLFAGAMKKISEISISQETVDSIETTGNMLIKLRNSIPESTWFDGKVELNQFGARVKEFGSQLVSYSESVSGMDEGKVSSSITQADRLAVLAQKLVNLDTSGIDNFNIEDIAVALAGYYYEIESIDSSDIDSSVTSAQKIIGLVKNLIGLDTSGITGFNIKSIGDKLKSYYVSVSSIDTSTVFSSINAANKLKILISSLAGLDTSGVGSFTEAVENLGSVQLEKITGAFSESTSKLTSIGVDIVNALSNGMKSAQSQLVSTVASMMTYLTNQMRSNMSLFNKIGLDLMTNMSNGFVSKRPAVIEAAVKPATSAVSSLRMQYGNFFSAGAYLVSGFASGISVNTYQAEAKAKAMAEAAEKAAREALAINSPSKVFRKIGMSVPEGFAMGIDKLGRVVKVSSTDMAKTAINGVKESIARISEMVNSDIDSQPTIRPVLDLSEVQTGASVIGSLFSDDVTIGANANANRIGYMMNQNNQNGTNDDVVSAIGKLSKKLDNVGNTTYNVAGITYDDGSNISTAVKDLVRAAKIERRA